MKLYHVTVSLPIMLFLACDGTLTMHDDEIASDSAALSAVFSGTVLDANGQPVPSARVTVNGVTRLTSTTGRYTVSVTTSQAGYVLDVRKDGHGPVNEFWTTGQLDLVHQLGKSFTKQINSTQNTIVIDPSSGIRVEIPANSLRSATGTPVQPVQFSIAPHDASDMPGDFTAQNASGQTVMLDTFGAVTLSAVDSQGKTLGLVEGASLQVDLPVPTSLGGATPACVLDGSCRAAMWRFDRTTGRWVEREAAAAFNTTVTRFTVKGGRETIDPADGLGTWNADVESTTPACTIIEFIGIPAECYNPFGTNPEPGIEVTFNQITASNTPKSKTTDVRSTATFIALYNLRPYFALDLSFTFPPGAPAYCATNLTLSSNPPANPGFPVGIPGGGATQFNTGAPAPQAGFPENSNGEDIDFNDVATGDHPCTSKLDVIWQ